MEKEEIIVNAILTTMLIGVWTNNLILQIINTLTLITLSYGISKYYNQKNKGGKKWKMKIDK